ncbi:MAG: excinuclease ABC subunit UvrB [bacterium]|nr:excinuclease ABC subunit UvrB [bacterium]
MTNKKKTKNTKKKINFKLNAPFSPSGDQPQAIKELIVNIESGKKHQTLLGVTGSGKTFTIANLVEHFNMPTLIISPNKTLAAQLYSEFKNFFPDDAVEYFISYYDYYQPEAYMPQSDTYIEKDASINDKIDRLRLRATASLLTQKNVIIIASVSCIYGLGSPEDYKGMVTILKKGQTINRKELLSDLVNMQYVRNELAFESGTFRIKGEVIDIYPAYLEYAVRLEFFDDELERIVLFNPVSGDILEEKEGFVVYPAKHFVMARSKIEKSIGNIRVELKGWLKELESAGKIVEAQRLKQKTEYDLEMLNELGYCNGVENYSRHLGGRAAGSRPFCLIDYFNKPFLTVIDESHMGVSQIRGMYNGDRARKQTLVDYGFRLPSALDNRPLQFDEFEALTGQTIYVSATPADYELEKSEDRIVEQIIRPTGLIDPEVKIRPIKGMMKELFKELKIIIKREERALVTTLTKKMAEDLSEYFIENGLKARYLHSEITALERVKIIAEFRQGRFDCLIGINLLREGLDLPEVSLVAILDADKEGFLRSERSLIQTSGRAARNANGKVLMFADRITGSMERALFEMNRRRKKQLEYNKVNNIVPLTITKDIDQELVEYSTGENKVAEKKGAYFTGKDERIRYLKQEMALAVEEWDFERAAELRDKIKSLNKQ